MPSPRSEATLRALRSLVGERHVLTDADQRAGYERDWTGRFVGRAAAVVRPGSADEVAAVLAWCSSTGTPVVPQGGNTGLVGGSVPDTAGRAVVLSTQRLTDLGPVDIDGGQVTAGAGVTLERVQHAAAEAGWAFGIDLAARGSATIGGMAATNAGGLHVVRHGAMRAQVLGVEAVLPTGTIVRHLAGLVKDNTGYDLAGLLVGSEGTLGVITAARLRLVAPTGATVTALVACRTAADAIALAGQARRALPGLVAIEGVWSAPYALVSEVSGAQAPLDVGPDGVAVLVEVDEHSADLVADLVGERPAVVATEPGPRQRLWHFRDAVTDSIARLGIPHKLDVTLPSQGLAGFAGEVAELVGQRGQVLLFGHLGDGNVHVNVLGLAPDDEVVDDEILRLVADHGGSISAEHGIGRAKRRWLSLNRSEAEIDTFRAIKGALDPAGVLNPGVLFDL